jgi:two-component system cell cycle response regulator
MDLAAGLRWGYNRGLAMTEERVEITLVSELAPDRLERAPGKKQATLTVLAGRELGALFVVTTRATVIGRSAEAHIRLEDDGVSRSHARIIHVDGQYVIEDLGSTNGTLLGEERIQGRAHLPEGARIALGSALLRFAMQDEIELEAAKRVYEASVRDGLTGIFNRRYFAERLTSEFAFAVRQGTALCALMIDIDHFKQINDRWGHQAGDSVLRRMGALLREVTRAEDLLARYGGEEFAVLARGISVIDARAFAERVRGLVANASIEWENEKIPVTVSIGLAHNRAGATASGAEQLVAAADKALYAAKAAGRNRVEVAASPGRYSVVRGDDPAAEPAPQSKRRTWEQTTFPLEDKASEPPPSPSSDRPPRTPRE